MTFRTRALPSRTHLGPGVALALSAALLVGCSQEQEAPAAVAQNVVQGGAPGEGSTVLDPEDVPVIEAPTHTQADVDFMKQMIGHHAQAIVMTSLVPERSDNEDLVLFVERMDISQVAEIEQMQQWLAERGEDMPDVDGMGHSGMAGMAEGDLMPGMLTAEELTALEQATGEDFERLFLEGMTRHHQGAIDMVEQLFALDGGQEQTVFQLAAHIQSDQAIEIQRMAAMYADL